MNRRTFIKLTGGGVILAAGAYGAYRYMQKSVFGMPQSALESWALAGSYSDPRKYVLSYAILAPNPHNMQPWVADLQGEDEIHLRLDTDLLLPATDPYGRQILMGLGCFLELLQIAATTINKSVDIEFFPDGEPGQYLDDRRMVVLKLKDDEEVSKDVLFDSIMSRRTDRRIYDLEQPLDAKVIAKISESRNPGIISAGIEIDPIEVEKIREIAKRAWKIEMITPQAIMESFHVLRVGTKEIEQHRDGLSLTDPFVVTLDRLGLFDRTEVPAEDSMAVTSQIADFEAISNSTPGYFWIITVGKARQQQVEAGMTYARANLVATSLGLSVHPNSQALQEYPEVAQEYEDIHNLLDAPKDQYTVQMLARIGYPPKGAARLQPSPRRDVNKFII